MSEKKVDYEMQRRFKLATGIMYETKTNSELFESKIPDGWIIIDDKLIIIENKKDIKLFNSTIKQLKTYLSIARKHFHGEIILMCGFGPINTFRYGLYNTDWKLLDNQSLEQFKTTIIEKYTDQIHKLNQYLYDNSINLPKTQKTLFIASCLIVLKIDSAFIEHYSLDTVCPSNEIVISNKMLELINGYYKDLDFTSQFNFITTSLNNKHLSYILKLLESIIKNNKHNTDILNRFYSEFCLWDRNNESSLGIVLTPDDIVNIMVEDLHLTDKSQVLDFCTGTGSFLVKCGKYTNNLIGVENNIERYTLAKCNFILHNLDTTNLHYNSCFNTNLVQYDNVIINPPFNVKCTDDLSESNITEWKSFTNEQRFIMYAVEHLKDNGIGCIIVPRSNFNNTKKFKEQFLKFVTPLKFYKCNSKLFEPIASVECVIVTFIKKPYSGELVERYDYTNDNSEIRNKQRIIIGEPTTPILKDSTELKSDTDWNDFGYTFDLDNNNIKKIVLDSALDEFYYSNKSKTYDDILLSSKLNIIEIELNKYFEPIKLKSFTTKTPTGDVPLYGATKFGEPVCYINNFSIDTSISNDVLIRDNGIAAFNKTGNGAAGYFNIYHGKFAIQSTMLPCKILHKIDKVNRMLISHQLHNIFNYFNGLTLSNFNKIKVKYIINYDMLEKIIDSIY